MKYLILAFLGFLIFASCNESSTIGKYKKEPLPSDFTYRITKDDSDDASDKNSLIVEISKKLTVEQIATLAEELYNSKSKKRRFYIFYDLANTPPLLGVVS
jgi:hypothetical protein